jgi:hypothetical protein
MKRLIAAGLITAALVVPPAASAFAASTGTAGQPNQSCQAQPLSPGSANTAPGSAFNTSGTAQFVYANPGSTGGTSSSNSHVVAQYDVACFQVSQSH